jgi:hypothetical protein
MVMAAAAGDSPGPGAGGQRNAVSIRPEFREGRSEGFGII